MGVTRLNRIWIAVTILLVITIVTTATIIWIRYPRTQPVEIVLSPAPEFEGQITIDGAISNPGIYPVNTEESLDSIIRYAGGTTGDADLTKLKLYIPHTGEERQPQKIDINRAELWLLESLPAIGRLKAQAIIDYREKNGPFPNTAELTRVAGIGESTYQQIKSFITVSQ